jgi:hypothetical protein
MSLPELHSKELDNLREALEQSRILLDTHCKGERAA